MNTQISRRGAPCSRAAARSSSASRSPARSREALAQGRRRKPLALTEVDSFLAIDAKAGCHGLFRQG